MYDVMSPSIALRSDLRTAVRNRYFYGKLLDVYHFDLEANYLNGKRRLLNRMISGYGVVCGLNIQRCAEHDAIAVTQGLALDKWGNEIIVPRKSHPVPLPDDVVEQVLAYGRRPEEGYDEPKQHEPGKQYEPGKPHDQGKPYEPKRPHDDRVVTVSICYHECDADPTPALAGDCHDDSACEAGAVREQYRLAFTAGAAPPISTHSRIPDVISGGRLDYAALVRWISEDCPAPQDDPCIPLANVRISRSRGGCEVDDIDVTVRPIVYTNDLLFELILALFHDGSESRRAK